MFDGRGRNEMTDLFETAPSCDLRRNEMDNVASASRPRSGSAELDLSYHFKRNGVLGAYLHGDAKERLAKLPDNTFNVAVTSPPYFWARDYGYDGQIGHEDAVEDYISALVDVFGEVKRVLHPEGVFFVNIGDTYYSGNGQPHGSDPRCSSRQFMRTKMRAVDRSGWDIPKKSLIGIPWKLAFAMQQRGWTLRADIIWNRCNAFSEPTARDRPHRQYEHVFMFSRSRFYSFDRSALPEEDVWNIPIERAKRIDHNAPFPTELVRRCIESGSPKKGKVLDPFVGSGTVLDVATQLGRHAVGTDMSAEYAREVRAFFSKRGAEPASAEALEVAMRENPTAWAKWPGNLRNFRKPGTPKAKNV
jgi:site-specific DNA-methyltransferase (adenine-specific)